MDKNLLPRCHRCGQHPSNGLYDGFRLGKVFFCSRCEEELLTYDIGSREYRQFALLLRGALFSKRERTASSIER